MLEAHPDAWAPMEFADCRWGVPAVGKEGSSQAQFCTEGVSVTWVIFN
jgi:hypothetical protein